MNIIILGQQGSGKGTQAELLARKFNLEHFDTGRNLRQVARMNTPLGHETNEIINVKKELVPTRILKKVMRIKVASFSREQGIVFDGIPRNLEQAQYFMEILKEYGRKVDQVYFVNIPEEESLERISKRWVCENCKKVLIMGKDVLTEKDVCPDCKGGIFQRVDDTPDGVRKRLKVFAEETMPVVNFFKEKNILTEINGKQPIEKVFQDIVESMQKLGIS